MGGFCFIQFLAFLSVIMTMFEEYRTYGIVAASAFLFVNCIIISSLNKQRCKEMQEKFPDYQEEYTLDKSIFWLLKFLTFIAVAVISSEYYYFYGTLAALILVFLNCIIFCTIQIVQKEKYYAILKEEADKYYEKKKKEADNYIKVQKKIIRKPKEESDEEKKVETKLNLTRMEKREQKKKNRTTLLLLTMIVGVFFGIPKLDEFLQKQAEQQRIVAEEQRIATEEQKKEQARIEKIEREKAEKEQRRKEDQELLEKGAENIESNSTEMIAYIKAKANQDAQNIEKESEEFNQAFQFIADNYPNYFKNNNMMEKIMYYSGIVTYVYKPRWKNEENEVPKSLYTKELDKLKVAQWTDEAVKNVYTNKETENSHSTESCLNVVGAYLNLVFPDKTFWEEPKVEPVPVVEVQEVVEKKEKMVWIPTNGGIKYHLHSECSGMVNPVQVTETEAKNKGFGMCKKCYR